MRPGVEDVVDEDHGPAVELEVEMGAVDDRLGARLAGDEIVAVEGDVEVAERDGRAAELADEGVQAAGEHGAPRVDADEGERAGILGGVLFDDLVRDPH